MTDQETSTFRDLHPYGLEPEQIQNALWVLLALMLFAILAYIFTAIRQVRDFGASGRTLMGMKPKNDRKDKREREARAEIKRIVERQNRNNPSQ
jgi:hypothetical protein